MKRLFFSYTLVAVLLLNVMGYYGIFIGLQYQNEVAMIKNLDADRYDESETITIKVPIAVPYVAGSGDFERVNGIFEHQGEFFRLVKQKYEHDTLTVVCIRDSQNERIHEALTDFVKTFSDQPADGSENSKITLTFIKDYIPQTFSINSCAAGWNADLLKDNHYTNLIPTFVPSVIHPPERS